MTRLSSANPRTFQPYRDIRIDMRRSDTANRPYFVKQAQSFMLEVQN